MNVPALAPTPVPATQQAAAFLRLADGRTTRVQLRHLNLAEVTLSATDADADVWHATSIELEISKPGGTRQAGRLDLHTISTFLGPDRSKPVFTLRFTKLDGGARALIHSCKAALRKRRDPTERSPRARRPSEARA